MKKHGFTLAEVLITLGIIGVVAALTAPALVSSSRNEANAAKLAVVVSNLENAFSNMMVSENVDSLFRTEAWQAQANKPAFAGRLGKYLHISGYKDFNRNQLIAYYNNNGPYSMDTNGGTDRTTQANTAWVMTNVPANAVAGANHIIITKSGAMIGILFNAENVYNQNEKNSIINNGGSLLSTAADVWIDINGITPPNTRGRDIFHFYLGDNGILYPMGGLDVSLYDTAAGGGANDNELWNRANSPYRCLDGNISTGLGCAARLIEEGYKMNY